MAVEPLLYLRNAYYRKIKMFPKIIPAILIAMTVFSHGAHAALSVGAGLEDYHWQETIDGAPLSPTETGLRYAINLNWMQDGSHGLLFGYRGKLYAGRVHYDTYYQGTSTPVATTTRYSGVRHEGQLAYRTDAADYKLDYIGGLGLDTWQRSINNNGFNQIEDFLVIYLRGGINLGRPSHEAGFHGGGGLKYPVAIWEDAHLDSMGYDSNPILLPKPDISLYAELGYRINNRWDVIGYYDSWRFKQSDIVITSSGGTLYGIYQPESSMDAYGLRVMYSF